MIVDVLYGGSAHDAITVYEKRKKGIDKVERSSFRKGSETFAQFRKEK